MSRPIDCLPSWFFGRTAYLVFYCGTTLIGSYRQVGLPITPVYVPEARPIRLPILKSECSQPYNWLQHQRRVWGMATHSANRGFSRHDERSKNTKCQSALTFVGPCL